MRKFHTIVTIRSYDADGDLSETTRSSERFHYALGDCLTAHSDSVVPLMLEQLAKVVEYYSEADTSQDELGTEAAKQFVATVARLALESTRRRIGLDEASTTAK